MNVSLTPTLTQYIEDKVSSGLYTSASEVIREALRLLQEQDQLRQLKLTELKQDIQAGLDSGPSQTLVIDNLKAKARKRRSAQGV
jgi:antitoxin ParD1/3/4